MHPEERATPWLETTLTGNRTVNALACPASTACSLEPMFSLLLSGCWKARCQNDWALWLPPLRGISLWQEVYPEGGQPLLRGLLRDPLRQHLRGVQEAHRLRLQGTPGLPWAVPGNSWAPPTPQELGSSLHSCAEVPILITYWNSILGSPG